MAIAISSFSIAIAIAALFLTWWSARHRLLFELHSAFVDPATSSARGALHQAFRAHGAEWHLEISSQELAKINSAIAHLDAIAFNAVRGYISRKDASVLWGRSMSECWENAAPYVEHRRLSQRNPGLWVFLDEFVTKHRGSESPQNS